MESINVAGVLQEAGDADSRLSLQILGVVKYFFIPYTSTFIKLFHLHQEFYAHHIVIINDGGMG